MTGVSEGSIGHAEWQVGALRVLKALEIRVSSAVAEQAASLAEYAEILARPTGSNAFYETQTIAMRTAIPLLLLVKDASETETRLVLLEALSWVCQGNPEMAAVLAASGHFDTMIATSFSSKPQAGYQEEQLVALQLAGMAADAVPEAASLGPLMDTAVALIAGPQDEQSKAPSVRSAAVELLVVLSHAPGRAEDIAARMPLPAAEALIAQVSRGTREHMGALCLLLANLCDLVVPHSRGQILYGHLAGPVWNKGGFFRDLRACLATALRDEPCPLLGHGPSGRRPLWKLLGACARLALAGYVHELSDCHAPMTSVIEVHGAKLQNAEGDTRAIRLSAICLRELLLKGPPATAAAIRARGTGNRTLEAALVAVAPKEPVADDLLKMLGLAS